MVARIRHIAAQTCQSRDEVLSYSVVVLRVMTRTIAAIVVALGMLATHADAASVTCAPCTVTIAGTPIELTGSFGLDPQGLDVTARTDHWSLGGLDLHDVVATARDHGDAIRACVSGSVGGARLVACGSLPRSFASLRAAAGADFAWRLDGAGFTGGGTGRLAWGTGGVRLEHVVAQVHGLALARVLAVVTRDRVTGTGDLDGELELRRGSDGLEIVRGGLHARGGGELRVRDAAWLDGLVADGEGVALHRRIAATLLDLAYDHLALTLAPPGGIADGTLELRGHGRRLDQDLDLTCHLHGLRVAAHSLATLLDR